MLNSYFMDLKELFMAGEMAEWIKSLHKYEDQSLDTQHL